MYGESNPGFSVFIAQYFHASHNYIYLQQCTGIKYTNKFAKRHTHVHYIKSIEFQVDYLFVFDTFPTENLHLSPTHHFQPMIIVMRQTINVKIM